MSAQGRDLLGTGMSLAVRRFRARLLGGLGLQPVRGKRALVLGCGDGAEADFLADLGYRVEAHDLEPHPAWGAIAARHRPKVRFRTADVAGLARLKGAYDLVLQKDMLHHVPDPAAVLAQMKRLTKAGGRLIALECNRLNPISYLHLTLLKGHEHFTPWRLRKLLHQAGLQDAVISRREARVWPVESERFQDLMDRVQDAVEKVPGVRGLAVYQVASWERALRDVRAPSEARLPPRLLRLSSGRWAWPALQALLLALAAVWLYRALL